MKIKTGKFEISINVEGDLSKIKTDQTPLLFLHGFTGSCREWKPLFSKFSRHVFPFAIDLIGHGKSAAPNNGLLYTIPAIVEQINIVLEGLSIYKLIVCGYSMGGRIALHFADRYPDMIVGLILESTTAGLQSFSERYERIQHDEELAKYIQEHSIKEFVERWLSHPLFQTLNRLSSDEINSIKKSKLRNRKIGLINSLRYAGLGRMDPLWDALNHFPFPVLLLTGSHDEKFTELNIEMAKQLKNGENKIIPDAGHNIHIEKPDTFVVEMNEFLEKAIFKKTERV